VLIPGAGTGALALYAASKGASVIAVEINPTACEDMEYNLRQSGLQDKVQIIQGNIFSTLKAYDRFDYVIAHPPIFRGGYNERQKNLNIYDPNFSFIQGLTSETMFGLINNGGRLILMYPSEYTALNLAQPEEDKYFFNLESKRALLLSKGLALINTAPQDRDNESVIWEITKPIRQPFIDIFTKESIFLAFQAAA